MSLIQLLKFKTWEMRLFKMPCFETPRFQTRTRVTVASTIEKSYEIATRNAKKCLEF